MIKISIMYKFYTFIKPIIFIMKDLFKNGIVVLLIIAALYILYLRECKRPDPCPAEDEVVVKKDVWKEMIALADKPPVVTIETVKVTSPIIYVPSAPLPPANPNPIDSTENTYCDSLVNEEINVYYDFKVKGILLDREWSYKPITTTVTIDSIIYIPKIIEILKPITKAKNGVYAYGLAGGNKTAFLFGGGLDLITKKETMIGYQYQRFGNESFHLIKLGGRIKIGKN